MKRTLFISPEAYAFIENGRLVEFLSPDETHGDIVLGRVDRIMPGLNCAFTDIGRKKDGFLPLKENSQSFTGPILRSGDRIPVQIRREETGEKGAYLSRDLTIPGRQLILMPCNRYIGVSARIKDPACREALRVLGADLADGRFGLVMRAVSADAPEEIIRREASDLWDMWREIQERLRTVHSPGELLFSCDSLSALHRDYGDFETVRCAELPPSVKQQLEASTLRKVSLKGGGNLIIDRCEAMTVIDVNSASATGTGAPKESTVTAVNLEACKEVAVQIRLRDLCGIILIDFIDMETETDRNRVLECFREAIGPDRKKTVIHGWTHLGLMEMTRKRD